MLLKSKKRHRNLYEMRFVVKLSALYNSIDQEHGQSCNFGNNCLDNCPRVIM